MESEMPRLNKGPVSPTQLHRQVSVLTGQALLDDMEQYRKEATSSPEAARQFLIDLGGLTIDGKTRNLIRG